MPCLLNTEALRGLLPGEVFGAVGGRLEEDVVLRAEAADAVLRPSYPSERPRP